MNYNELLANLRRDLMEELTRNQAQHFLWGHSLIYWMLFLASVVMTVIAVAWTLGALGRIYNVWASRKDGEAALAESKNEQLVQVSEAEGRLKSAELHKQAEIISAEAVSKSVEIIGNALKDNHGYLQWQWIHMMEKNPGGTIYVPTEAGLPILEAGQRKSRQQVSEE